MSLGKEFDIIVKVLNTEKTAKDLAGGKYYFEVATSATKDDIKNAIEKIFGVDVEGVNVINTEGKVKKFKGTVGKRRSVKKAVITLKKGQDINFGKLE